MTPSRLRLFVQLEIRHWQGNHNSFGTGGNPHSNIVGLHTATCAIKAQFAVSFACDICPGAGPILSSVSRHVTSETGTAPAAIAHPAAASGKHPTAGDMLVDGVADERAHVPCASASHERGLGWVTRNKPVVLKARVLRRIVITAHVVAGRELAAFLLVYTIMMSTK